MHLPLLLLLAAAGFAGGDPKPSDPPRKEFEDLVIAADRLHVGDGEVVEDAVVVIHDGKLRSITGGATPPAGAVYVEGAELTPGLVDAYSYMGVGIQTVEQERETTASMRVARTADLDSESFQRALEQGVTAAYLSPDSLNVIGGLGAVVKTHGGRPGDLFAPADSAARVLLGHAALKVTVGADPSFRNSPPRFSPPRSVFQRRPNTRMGAVWQIRDSFYRAREYADLRKRGAAEPDPELDVLVEVLEGRLPVRVQARRSHDVQTALRLREEFGWEHLIIEEGTEAYRVAPLLAAAGVPVVIGPAYDTLARAVARGTTLEEFRAQACPPPVCCEHLDDTPEFPEGEEHVHADGPGFVQLGGPALDLVYLTLPRYSAVGFNIGRRQEGDRATPALAALLEQGGVTCALGAGEAHDAPETEASVIQQARTAVRYGLDPARALAMATSEAARLCFAEERLGSLQAGLDADLVLWSGDPMRADSKPILVIVDGGIALDLRPSATPE